MAVPKRKSSKSKVRMRRRAHRSPSVALGVCSECGAACQPHRVCPDCGHYKGRQVITVEAD